MSAADTAEQEAPPRRSRLPLLLGAILGLAFGAGGFFAAYTGLLPCGPDTEAHGKSEGGGSTVGAPGPSAGDETEFVAIDPMVVMLGPAAGGRHLRFRAELEVLPGASGAVSRLMPRILDVLNGYLRAVPPEELEAPSALVRIRAQMLRRIQLVTGEGRVRDLLVTEFVLN